MDLPLFPLNLVLFPNAELPLHIFEPRYRQMIGECIEERRPFGVVLIREGGEVGGGAEPYKMGTTARIRDVERVEDGRMNIVAVGEDRFRILDTSSERPYLTGSVDLLDEYDGETPAADVAADEVRALYLRLMRAALALSGQWVRGAELPAVPGRLADHVASRVDVELATRQQLLEELSVPRRLTRLTGLLGEAAERMEARAAAAQRGRLLRPGALN